MSPSLSNWSDNYQPSIPKSSVSFTGLLDLSPRYVDSFDIPIISVEHELVEFVLWRIFNINVDGAVGHTSVDDQSVKTFSSLQSRTKH